MEDKNEKKISNFFKQKSKLNQNVPKYKTKSSQKMISQSVLKVVDSKFSLYKFRKKSKSLSWDQENKKSFNFQCRRPWAESWDICSLLIWLIGKRQNVRDTILSNTLAVVTNTSLFRSVVQKLWKRKNRPSLVHLWASTKW